MKTKLRRPAMDSRMIVMLPVPLHDTLRRVAAANDRSLAAEVRVAVQAHCRREERRAADDSER